MSSIDLDLHAPFRAAVILADIPARYRVWNNKSKSKARRADAHYPTMTWQELKDMGDLVRAVSYPPLAGAALFAWVFPSCRPDQEDLFRTWGFTYKTKAFTWCKLNKRATSTFFMGMGYYTRANTEDVDLWVLGKPQRRDKGVRQLIATLDAMEPETPAILHPITRHSAKPPQVHDACERLLAGPYLELFAREPRAGWICLGHEVNEGMDIREALRRLALGMPIPNVDYDTRPSVVVPLIAIQESL